jgi:hypothetical protein
MGNPDDRRRVFLNHWSEALDDFARMVRRWILAEKRAISRLNQAVGPTIGYVRLLDSLLQTALDALHTTASTLLIHGFLPLRFKPRVLRGFVSSGDVAA